MTDKTKKTGVSVKVAGVVSDGKGGFYAVGDKPTDLDASTVKSLIGKGLVG